MIELLDKEMHTENKTVLLIAMPFAGTNIPSIQLVILNDYLTKRHIDIKTNHLYLKAAEFYGINNYNFLINPPNDSYPAQMVFSRYVFPDYWKNTEEKFRTYFNEKMLKNVESQINNLWYKCYTNFEGRKFKIHSLMNNLR